MSNKKLKLSPEEPVLDPVWKHIGHSDLEHMRFIPAPKNRVSLDHGIDTSTNTKTTEKVGLKQWKLDISKVIGYKSSHKPSPRSSPKPSPKPSPRSSIVDESNKQIDQQKLSNHGQWITKKTSPKTSPTISPKTSPRPIIGQKKYVNMDNNSLIGDDDSDSDSETIQFIYHT